MVCCRQLRSQRGVKAARHTAMQTCHVGPKTRPTSFTCMRKCYMTKKGSFCFFISVASASTLSLTTFTNKKLCLFTLTCSCLSCSQLQSRVSACGGGLLSLHWKIRIKWRQIKTYTTPAVGRDSIFVDVWLRDVVEALHKTQKHVQHQGLPPVLSTSNLS